MTLNSSRILPDMQCSGETFMLDAAEWFGQYVGEHFGCRAVVYSDTLGLHIIANKVKSDIDVLAAG